MSATEERLLGRGKNALLSFFEKKLYIPKIYLNAEWLGHHVDLLAVDRDGSGDVHAVLIFAARSLPGRESFLTDLTADIEKLLDLFEGIETQYKYIATIAEIREGDGLIPGFPSELTDRAFAPDGIGRVGFLAVDFTNGADPQTRLLLKPERFRAKVAKLADDYVAKHTPDWEIRA
jgi:hypothetical protein